MSVENDSRDELLKQLQQEPPASRFVPYVESYGTGVSAYWSNDTDEIVSISEDITLYKSFSGEVTGCRIRIPRTSK